MNQNRLLLIQIQTLPPSMHHEWKEILGIVYANNQWEIIGGQLLTKSRIQLQDNSNVHTKPHHVNMSPTIVQIFKNV